MERITILPTFRAKMIIVKEGTFGAAPFQCTPEMHI